MCVQLATVCRDFAHIIPGLPELRQRLAICDSDSNHTAICLDSQLLLSWAGQIEALCLNDGVLHVPGVDAVLNAASDLAWLKLLCHTTAFNAATDRLLAKLCTVEELVLQGTVRPRCIPETMETLSIWSFFGPRQADAVLNRCERLHSLQKLSLHFLYGSEVKFTSLKQLDSLRSVTLGFAMTVEDAQPLDLAWIGQQSLQQLDLSNCIQSSQPAKHATVVQHLAQLNTRKQFDQVRLSATVPFPRNIQMMWSTLNIRDLTINMFYNSAFGTADLALQVLPASCSRVQIRALASGHSFPVFISWSAIAARSAIIHVVLQPCQALHVLGTGSKDEACGSVSDLQQPWQLVVKGPARLHGLPASQTPCKPYLLQSQAAWDAGWTANKCNAA